MHSLTVMNTHDKKIKIDIEERGILLDIDFMTKEDYKLGIFLPSKYSLFDGSCYKVEINEIEYLDIRLLLQRVISGDIRIIVAICKYIESLDGRLMTLDKNETSINMVLNIIYENACCFIKAYLQSNINNIESILSSYLYDRRKYKRNSAIHIYNIIYSLSNDSFDLDYLYSNQLYYYEYVNRLKNIKKSDIVEMYKGINSARYKLIIKETIDKIVDSILLHAI